VTFGVAVVAALVLPRAGSPAAGMLAVISLLGATTALGAITETYGTSSALALALAVLVAGVTAGYAVGATFLPHLSRRPRPRSLAVRPPGDGTAIILLACTEPERYSVAAVAYRQDLLARGAEIEVPSTALPFVFFADRSRYRAAGRMSPGPALARKLARIVQAEAGAKTPVTLAWCHTADSLVNAVVSCGADGASSIAVVTLGPPESGPLDEARALLDSSLRTEHAPRVVFGPNVWNDRFLPARLAERVMGATVGATAEEVGVVLLCEGAPPAWERRYAAAGEADNYFAQRVRTILCEDGVAASHVRVAWLAWQTPDVTEVVRHLAALGCTRIVVAPATIALPTLETMLDLGHAVTLARVPETVTVVTLTPWGDDPGFVGAVQRSVSAALGELRA